MPPDYMVHMGCRPYGYRISNVHRRVFSTKEDERDFLIAEYNSVFDALLDNVRTLGDVCNNVQLARRVIAVITNTVNDAAREINGHYISEGCRQLWSL